MAYRLFMYTSSRITRVKVNCRAFRQSAMSTARFQCLKRNGLNTQEKDQEDSR